MSDDELLEKLRSVPLFQDLSEKELKRVARAGKEVRFDPGKVLATEGEGGIGFHLILEGEAEVRIGGRQITTLGPGRYFGEMSLLDGKPRSATVTVASPMRTFALASWDFLPILDEVPSISRKLLVELSRRLREAAESPSQ